MTQFKNQPKMDQIGTIFLFFTLSGFCESATVPWSTTLFQDESTESEPTITIPDHFVSRPTLNLEDSIRSLTAQSDTLEKLIQEALNPFNTQLTFEDEPDLHFHVSTQAFGSESRESDEEYLDSKVEEPKTDVKLANPNPKLANSNPKSTNPEILENSEDLKPGEFKIQHTIIEKGHPEKVLENHKYIVKALPKIIEKKVDDEAELDEEPLQVTAEITLDENDPFIKEIKAENKVIQDKMEEVLEKMKNVESSIETSSTLDNFESVAASFFIIIFCICAVYIFYLKKYRDTVTQLIVDEVKAYDGQTIVLLVPTSEKPIQKTVTMPTYIHVKTLERY